MLRIDELFQRAEYERQGNKHRLIKVHGVLEGVYEPGGGYLEIENAIKAYARLAVQHGAVLQFNETVVKYVDDKKINAIRVGYRDGKGGMLLYGEPVALIS